VRRADRWKGSTEVWVEGGKMDPEKK